MTESGPSLMGANPEPVADIYPINPSTAPQQSKKLPDPLVFTGKQQELWSFLSRLRNKLTSNTDCYPTKAN